MNDIEQLMQKIKELIESSPIDTNKTPVYLEVPENPHELQHILIESGDLIPNAEGGRRLDNRTFHRGFIFFIRLIQPAGQSIAEFNSYIKDRHQITCDLFDLFQSETAGNIEGTTDLIINSVKSVFGQNPFTLDNFNMIDFNITIFKLKEF